MAVKERVVDYDHMRGIKGSITIRFDGDDLVRLSCYCEYDPALCSEKGNEVMLVRKIEIRQPDGSWELYPSATWLNGVQSEDQLQSKAFLKKTDGEGFDVMASTDGVPDGELLVAAEKAGVYTETIDG